MKNHQNHQQYQQKSYQVNKIIDKIIKDTKEYYKVWWKGYPKNQATWEPRKNLMAVEDQLNLFDQQLKSLLQQHSKQDSRQNLKHKKALRVRNRKIRQQRITQCLIENEQENQKQNSVGEPLSRDFQPNQQIDADLHEQKFQISMREEKIPKIEKVEKVSKNEGKIYFHVREIFGTPRKIVHSQMKLLYPYELIQFYQTKIIWSTD